MSLRVTRRKGTENLYLRGTSYGVTVYESTGTSERSAAEAIRIKRYPEGITEGPMAGFDGKVLTGVFLLNG